MEQRLEVRRLVMIVVQPSLSIKMDALAALPVVGANVINISA